MLTDLALMASAAAVGLALQRRGDGSARLRERVWTANYVVLIPLAAVYAFLSIEIDRALAGAIACAVAAWWMTVFVAWAYARIAARGSDPATRSRRGALLVVGAFPNTGFIGFPLAHLAFGDDGLRLAVIYDQISLLVPAIVVGVLMARHHTGRSVGRTPGAPPRSIARELATSPPLWTVTVLVSLRATVLPEPVELDELGAIVGHLVGPVGFLLLGLSIPLQGFVHDRREVFDTVGASLVRVVAAPALIGVWAAATGAHVPAALYLIAAMPTAFHALVVARLHDMHPEIVRLGVLMTTTVAVAAALTIVLVRG